MTTHRLDTIAGARAARRPSWRLLAEVAGFVFLLALSTGVQRYLFALRDGQSTTLWYQVLYSFTVWSPWIPLTLLIVQLARRFPLEGPRWRRSLGVHLAASVLFAPLKILIYVPTVMLFEVIFDIWRTATALEIPGRIAGYLVIEMADTPILYWVVLGVVSTFSYRRRLRERELRESRLEAQLAEARIQALRQQLNPHFLFNTLNSIATLMHRDVAAAELMLERLGELLRAALEAEDRPLALLLEEIDLTRLYLAIEQVRFADRLRVVIELEPDAEDALVPRLLLQPLVENAVRHGIAPRTAPGKVRVSARRAGERLLLVVEDDGNGLGSSPKSGSGLGLRNTRERLEVMYGQDAEMTVSTGSEGGVGVTISLPYRSAPEGEGGVGDRLHEDAEGAQVCGTAVVR